jgi:hypothetical protein
MSEATWVIAWRDRNWVVRPFRNAETALEHARSHYFDPREAWDQVDAAATRLRGEYARTADEVRRVAVAREGQARYEAAIRRLTGPGRVDAAEIRPYRGYATLMVATDTGIFAAFGEKLSDLYTAYRPLPAVVRSPLSLQNFRDSARRKLASF